MEMIEISTCPDCGHFPAQFIALPGGHEPFALHLRGENQAELTSAWCATHGTRKLIQRFENLHREFQRSCDMHESAATRSIELLDLVERMAANVAASGYSPVKDSNNPLEAWFADALAAIAKAKGEAA